MRDDDIIHVRTDGRFESLVEIAARSDASAVLEAAEALRRDEPLAARHAAVLFEAVARRRGQYIIRLEAEVTAYCRLAGDKANGADQATFLAPKQEELRALFRADVEQVIREAS